jgi:hypothetical protein
MQEYDFNNQFWSPVNVFHGPGPLPRWGASGGIDISTQPVQDPLLSGPNNTFYVAGGFNGTQASSLSDVWRLHISGTLSPNLPNDTIASWDHLTIGQLPARGGQAGAVIAQQLTSVGGCNSSLSASCTQGQDSYVIDVQRRAAVSPKACPAPRTSPVLVPNKNSFSTSFLSQVYLLLGTLNATQWQDDNGLNSGEVVRFKIFNLSMPFKYFIRPCLISMQVFGAESYLLVTLEHPVASLHFLHLGKAPQRSHIHSLSWVRHATLRLIPLYVIIGVMTLA